MRITELYVSFESYVITATVCSCIDQILVLPLGKCPHSTIGERNVAKNVSTPLEENLMALSL